MRSVSAILSLFLFAVPLWAQTGTITGVVTDGATGDPLIGANVIVDGTVMGGATDEDGQYVISGLAPGAHVVLFTYTGYQNAEVAVTVVAGETVQMDVALNPGIELDPVQVTAGRQQEKMLEAPASVTVLGGREIQLEAPQTAVRALRNVVGLDIVQSGIDRHEVVLRGFNNAFSSAAFVMTDYRQAGAAVIGVNMHGIMPSLPIDIERVEVVRGPGSALYGSGVDAGVIHYITKDAFSHSGITIAAGGGQQSLLNFQGRVAGVVGEKLGLKVTGVFGSANDFELEACDEAFIKAKEFSKCPDVLDAEQLFIDGPRDNKFKKYNLTGSAEYRFGKSSSLIFNGGIGSVHGTVLSGIGTIQGVGYQASFAQMRFNRGHFFAQAYLNRNDAGDSYIYNGGSVVELSTQTNVQAQYDLHLGGDREELIMGVDLEFLSPNSDGTVYGRNEDNDDIQEFGAYVQSKTQLSSKLDVVVALRGDYHNLFEKVSLSPRAGFVFKPNASSSFRFTYNNAVANPSPTSLFIDLVAAKLPLGGDAYLNVRGRGGRYGYTWNRNPAFTEIGAPTDLVASSLLPGMEGADVPVGLSTGLVYGLVYQGMASIPDRDLAEMLITALNLDPAFIDVLAAQMEAIKAFLHPDVTQVQGFSAGQLGMLNLSSQTIDPVPNELLSLPRIKQQKSQAFEVGYKGIIKDKMLLAVDAYYAQKKNFVGALQMRTPFVLVPTLTQDLTRDLASGIANNEGLRAMLELLGAATGLDLSPEATAALLIGLAGGDLPSGSTPIAVVQPKENNAGAGNLPELMVTYPNFGNIRYYGFDAALQILASDNLAVFANLSWVSDEYFDADETGEEDPALVLALNAPSIKFKLGGTYRLGNGLSVTASGRYVDGFSMISGQYIGYVDPYFLADIGVGYSIGGGLRADLNVSNLTNNEHREFIGAPKIGRIGTLRLLYDMGW